MTPQEREARAELTILTTFNLKRAENAFSLAESEVALGRDGYTMARAWAQQAGIYTLDMRANGGRLQIVSLRCANGSSARSNTFTLQNNR